tara:strand:+ start:471 stop:1010 length:540 start_codon:yes stop_codon:yes gene_type:complete
MQTFSKFLIKIIGITTFLISLNSCGTFSNPGDARKMEMEGRERAKKNVEEGRGFSINKIGERSTNYEFSTSNPLWRATFDVIDFMPLVTVDYAGGMIVTDWYTDANTTNDSLKFTIRFLSNEVRADSLKIIIHKKTCKVETNCIVKKIASNRLENTIRSDIIKKAAALNISDKKKKKKN